MSGFTGPQDAWRGSLDGKRPAVHRSAVEYRIPLPGGGTFTFAGPFPLSAADWVYVLNVIEVMKPGLIADKEST